MINKKQTKFCTKCHQEKSLNDFHKCKKNKDGLKIQCKCCRNLDNQKYYKNNIDIIKQKRESWYINNPDYNKNYYINNSETIKERSKQWSLNNQDKQKKNHKQWHLNNPGYDNKYSKIRREIDPTFKLKGLLRNRIKSVLKGVYKSVNTEKLLMCSWEEARNHISFKFKPEWTWENHGKVWEIDHIIPCSFFNLEDQVELYMCFRYQNLQPLSIEENRKKFDNIL